MLLYCQKHKETNLLTPRGPGGQPYCPDCEDEKKDSLRCRPMPKNNEKYCPNCKQHIIPVLDDICSHCQPRDKLEVKTESMKCPDCGRLKSFTNQAFRCENPTCGTDKPMQHWPMLGLPTERIMTALTSLGDQQEIAELGLKMIDLMLRKNKDYGSTVFLSPCLAPQLTPGQAIEVRLSDKIDRFKQLQQSEANVDESIEDTAMDAAAYFLLWIINNQRKDHGTSKRVDHSDKPYTIPVSGTS